MFVLFLDDLDTQLPLRVRPSLNGIEQVSAMKVRVLSVELEVSFLCTPWTRNIPSTPRPKQENEYQDEESSGT